MSGAVTSNRRRRVYERKRALLGVMCAALACSAPPTSIDDSPDPPGDFAWVTGFENLDEAILSTCGRDGEFLAVGGDDEAAIVEWRDPDWRVAPAVAGAGVLWWCWLSPDGSAWAVGEGGTVLHRTPGVDGIWSLQDTRGAVSAEVTLYGVWGAAADDIYAVGGSLTNSELPVAIAHFDGQQWLPIPTDGLPGETLFKVWGLAANDIWAVGANGTALHFDGAEWTATVTDASARLTAVWGTGPDDVYAVGGLGTGVVLRWDGAAWSTFASVNEELAGVWTAPGQALYVGGNRGLLIRYDLGTDGLASAESATLVTPIVDRDVHALHGSAPPDGTSGPAHVVAAATDLLSGASTGWRGTIVTHGQPSLAGPVVRPLGMDAGMPPDAGVGGDGGVDAGPTGPGPGELCGMLPNICDQVLECWLVISAGEYICTQPCADASECGAYGPDACCERPGFQTLETVCLPGSYEECL